MPTYDLTGDIGVGEVGQIFRRTLGWIFREQLSADVGIDGQAELLIDHASIGKLIACQIKSGPSWFRERQDDGIVYRGSKKHLDYWLKFSLPVVIILHDPTDNTAYWAAVTKDAATETEKGWWMIVPTNQRLNETARGPLSHLAADIERVRAELESIRKQLEGYLCPYCRAGLTTAFDAPMDDEHKHWDYRIVYGCGYVTFGGSTERPCPKSDEFPSIDEYELHVQETTHGYWPAWSCYAEPKTKRARLLSLRGAGDTREDAEADLRKIYEQCANGSDR